MKPEIMNSINFWLKMEKEYIYDVNFIKEAGDQFQYEEVILPV